MSMTSISDRLASVEARLAIQDLVSRYAVAVDSRDVEGLVALYTDDVNVGGGRRGHEALFERFTSILLTFYRTMHQVVGHVINLEGPDSATGTVYCRAEHECGSRWVAVAICYFDRYERRGDQWLFAARKPRVFYHADMEHGPKAPYNVWPGREDGDRGSDLPHRWSTWSDFWSDVPRAGLGTLTPSP
jgi:ketosteroid isomerase-like protein